MSPLRLRVWDEEIVLMPNNQHAVVMLNFLLSLRHVWAALASLETELLHLHHEEQNCQLFSMYLQAIGRAGCYHPLGT